MIQIDYIILLTVLVLCGLATSFVTRRYGLTLPNFQGKELPAIGGLGFLLYAEFAYAYLWLTHGITAGAASAFFLVTFGFGLLGLTDDLYGSRKDAGFRGHFKALLRGRLTTGIAKVIGGTVTSLCAGYVLARPSILSILVAALVIALCANTANLLDVRPGRMLFIFLVGSALITVGLAAHGVVDSGLLLYVALPAAACLYILDAGGITMLGDVGSNAFGAVLGVSIVLLCPLQVQIATVVVLGALQIWTEGHSISAAIEMNPVLRAIDRRVGIR